MPLHSSIQVFFDENNRGTRADIYHYNKMPSLALMQQIAHNSDSPATVFLTKNPNQEFVIRIFNQTHEIQTCGHGLLALAGYLQDKGHFQESLLHVDTDTQQFILRLDRDALWVGFEPLKINPVNIENVDMKAFSKPAVKAAYIGDENGYLILEWAEDYALAELKVDYGALKNAHSRAIIATQKSKDDYDFNLRYFAPRHGVNEDLATGSANRVLASYWQPLLLKDSFTAQQLSESGAIILSQIYKNKVWISGNIRKII